MTIDMLLTVLLRIKKEHGNAPVMVFDSNDDLHRITRIDYATSTSSVLIIVEVSG